MKKKKIILITISAIIVLIILTIKMNEELLFHKAIKFGETVLIDKMNDNKSFNLKSKYLDKLFVKDQSDKIVLFLPSTYSTIEIQNVFTLTDTYIQRSNNENKFWLLTNDKNKNYSNSIDAAIFTNQVNVPGLVFQSEIGKEEACLFTFDVQSKVSKVLWASEFNQQNLENY